MGDVKDTTAAIVTALESDTGITATVLTHAEGTLDQVLADENVSFPAILVFYEGAEYSPHDLLGSRISEATRTWNIYTIAKASGSSTDVAGDSSDILERVVAILQGLTIDSGRGELWPITDSMAYSEKGVVAYMVEMSGVTRMAGI